MRDERGLNCSFRNVSLGKLPVRALAVAPSLSPSMRISHRTHRGHAVLSVWDLLWGRRYAIGFELADADLTDRWSRLSWHSGRTLQPRSNHSLAILHVLNGPVTCWHLNVTISDIPANFLLRRFDPQCSVRRPEPLSAPICTQLLLS